MRTFLFYKIFIHKGIMKQFIKDMFTEDKNDNKYSSKKMMGIVSGFLAFIGFVLDSLKIYDVNMEMFEGMLIFSATMLGVSVVRGFTKRNDSQ